ncbi:MAG: V-type ATP synthase subunit E [Gemmatimonadota bacterium]|nr:MAG: V-type ATP synthase subunit E [Gemmatimonadota bacterium]
MAIDRITKKIMEDAEAEAKEILAKADNEIETVKADTAKTVTEIEGKAREEAAKEAEQQKRRIVSRAQAEMRKELLAEKQNLIDESFRKAFASLAELNAEKYSALMKKLFLQSVEEGDEEVILASHDKGIDWSGLLSDVNRQLSAQNRKGALALSGETREMAGGFVLRKGRKEINCDLKLIVESMREAMEFEVANILWGERAS